MLLWPFQETLAWTNGVPGRVTDEARLWLNELYRFLSPKSGSPVRIGGDLTGDPATPTVSGIQTRRVSSATPTNGQVLTWVAASSDWEPKAAATVTSVGLAMPAEFTVTNSPVTTTGILTASKAVQAVSTVYAGPSSGGSAAPTFRILAAVDIPKVIKVNGIAVGI